MANYYPTGARASAQDFRGAQPSPRPAPRPSPRPRPAPRKPARRPRTPPARPARPPSRPAPRVPFRNPKPAPMPNEFGKRRYAFPKSPLTPFQRRALQLAFKLPNLKDPSLWLGVITGLMDLSQPWSVPGQEVPAMPGWEVYWQCGSGGTMLSSIGSPSGCGFFSFVPPTSVIGAPVLSGFYYYAPYYAYDSPHPTVLTISRYLPGICYRRLATDYTVGDPFPVPELIPMETPVPPISPDLVPEFLPITEPAPQPDPRPGVRVTPKRHHRRALEPWRSPTYRPEVGPEPVPPIAPGPGVVIDVGPRPDIKPHVFHRPLTHTPRRPPDKTKEKKVKGGLPPGVTAALLNGITEGLDALNALWEALPDAVKFADKLAAWKQGKKFPTALDKAQSLWKNLDQMDWDAAVDNLIAEHAEDSFYGRIGRAQARVNRALNTPLGPSLRPLFDAINAVERSF